MPETQKLTLPVVDLARKNYESRKVLWTGDKTQLVLMAIPEGARSAARSIKDTTSGCISWQKPRWPGSVMWKR